MNGWTFLLSGLMAGGSLLTMADIWKENIGHFSVAVLMALIGVGCVALAQRQKNKYRLSGLILLVPWPVALALTGFHGYVSGMKAWINLLITQWNAAHEEGIALLSGNAMQHDLWASTIVIALLCGEIAGLMITLRKYWLCALYCIIWLLVQLFSDAFSPWACICLFVPMLAVHISNKKARFTHRGVVWIVGLAAVMAVCAVLVPQDNMMSMAKLRSAMDISIRNMRYGQPVLPEGHVDKASHLKANEEEMLTVTSDQEKTFYLKGYSGARYVDGCWKPLSNAVYGGEYSGMLKWLAKSGFNPLTQSADYYALSDDGQSELPEVNQLKIDVADAYRYPVYAPASLYQVQSGHAKAKKDAEMISRGLVGARHYTLEEYSGSKPSELIVAQDWVSDPQSDAQKQYVQAEAVYREFVYEHYLDVDTETEQVMQQIFWDDYDETNDGIYSAVCWIRDKLEATVSYTYEPKDTPEGKDPTLWFLTQSHEGNAVMYASAAVEALRVHGIPARYAEGYYVSDTDFQKSENGSVTVTGLNAHAWVEVYFDGIGWLPIEVTPGYYYDTVTLRQMIHTSDVIRKTAAIEDDPNRADPLSTAGSQGGMKSSEVIRTVRNVAAMISGMIAILILMLILLVIFFEMRRAICILKRKKYLESATQEEKTAEIEGRIFLLLKLWGIEARLGWNTEATDQRISEQFDSIKAGEYTRVCCILEKAVYGGCVLEAYEMRTLYYFFDRISEEHIATDWKMRLKLRYACLMKA